MYRLALSCCQQHSHTSGLQTCVCIVLPCLETLFFSAQHPAVTAHVKGAVSSHLEANKDNMPWKPLYEAWSKAVGQQQQ